jgi:hypothetical protein
VADERGLPPIPPGIQWWAGAVPLHEEADGTFTVASTSPVVGALGLTPERELWHAAGSDCVASLLRRGESLLLRIGCLGDASEQEVELTADQLGNLARVLGAVLPRRLPTVREDG